MWRFGLGLGTPRKPHHAQHRPIPWAKHAHMHTCTSRSASNWSRSCLVAAAASRSASASDSMSISSRQPTSIRMFQSTSTSFFNPQSQPRSMPNNTPQPHHHMYAAVQHGNIGASSSSSSSSSSPSSSSSSSRHPVVGGAWASASYWLFGDSLRVPRVVPGTLPLWCRVMYSVREPVLWVSCLWIPVFSMQIAKCLLQLAQLVLGDSLSALSADGWLHWLLYGEHVFGAPLFHLVAWIAMYTTATSHWNIHINRPQPEQSVLNSHGLKLGIVGVGVGVRVLMLLLLIPFLCFLTETLFPYPMPFDAQVELLNGSIFDGSVLTIPTVGWVACMLFFRRMYAIAGPVSAYLMILLVPCAMNVLIDKLPTPPEAHPSPRHNTLPMELASTAILAATYQLCGNIIVPLAVILSWNTCLPSFLHTIIARSFLQTHDDMTLEAHVAQLTHIEEHVSRLQTWIRAQFHRYIRVPYMPNTYDFVDLESHAYVDSGDEAEAVTLKGISFSWNRLLNPDGTPSQHMKWWARRIFQALDEEGKGYLTPEQWKLAFARQTCTQYLYDAVVLACVRSAVNRYDATLIPRMREAISVTEPREMALEEIGDIFEQLRWKDEQAFTSMFHDMVVHQTGPFMHYHVRGSFVGMFGSRPDACTEDAWAEYFYRHIMSMNLAECHPQVSTWIQQIFNKLPDRESKPRPPQPGVQQPRQPRQSQQQQQNIHPPENNTSTHHENGQNNMS